MSATVPTTDEHNALVQNLAALDGEVRKTTDRVSVLERPVHEVVVTEGRNDAAIAAAVNTALAEGYHVVLPPGEYRLARPLLDYQGETRNVEGFTIRGTDRRRTRVIATPHAYAPASPWENNLVVADGVRFARFADMTFVSSSANNSFAYLWSVAGGKFNNRWSFDRVEWQGTWNRVLGLDGDATANLNSELSLTECETAPSSIFADAFLRSGVTGKYNQMNQFVNYWVTRCNLSLTRGTVFKLVRGGSLRVSCGSWSAGSKDAGPITWFSMPETNFNNRGATQLSVRDIRFEPKRSDHLIIDCRWGSGTVTFEDCVDLCSAQSTANAEWNLHRYYGAAPWGAGRAQMPTVRYRSHQGIGYHSYHGPAAQRGSIAYDGCYWFAGVDGGVVPMSKVLRWTDGTPRARFTDCDNVLEGQ